MNCFTFYLWFFAPVNFEYCMILCSRMVFSSCRQDNQFCGAILQLLCPLVTSLSAWKFHYDINDSKTEVAIIFWNFHSQLGFVVKEVEGVREKGESLKWACAERLCRKGAKMSKVFFYEKLLCGKNFVLYLWRVKR